MLGTTVISYDDQGRVLSSVYTAPGPFGGPGERSATHTYLPDGSERIDYYDGFTDIIGQDKSFATRTAECLAIDADIGVPDTRCHVME